MTEPSRIKTAMVKIIEVWGRNKPLQVSSALEGRGGWVTRNTITI